MASSFQSMIKKLQTACNQKFDAHILYNKRQFYGDNKKRRSPITMHVIAVAVYDEDNERYKNIELYASASEINVVKFMRDYWYELNDWEVPTDDKEWLETKQKYMDRH